MLKIDRDSINWKTLGLGIVLNTLVLIAGILLYHAYIVKSCQWIL